MKIILIRHGQSNGNKTNTVQGHTDSGLSELGKEQAKQLKDCFNLGEFDVIYSSNLPRATQTSEPTAKKLDLEVEIDPDLREANFGIWEGLTYDEVKEQYPKEYTAWHEDYYVRPSWFESYEAHSLRVRAALERILLSHNLNDKIAVFTHGGSIKTQLGYFNKLSGQELAKLKTINCSLTLIEFNPSLTYESGKLVYYNKDVINALSLRDF